jgi:hypothetical protein
MELFEGSVRSFGQFNPKRVGKDGGPHVTARRAPTREDFEKHLRGTTGIGIVPIVRDKFATWGAIDIDIDNIDHSELESAVHGENLPLVVCRSKSGGAHLYLFLREAVLVPAIRAALTGYAKKVGHPGAEIFPKQNETSADILGNWINLPYFGGESTDRYSVEGGKAANLDYFLESARNKAVTRVQLFNKENDNPDAPPCVQSMIHNGVGPGMRNEALYSIAIYCKRAFPETWKDKVMDINAAFTDPLPAAEVRTILGSIARRDYLYKCKQEPCKSLCDSNVCITRKYGITPGEQKAIVNVETPVFGQLTKYTTEPVHWSLEINGQPVRLYTEDLANYEKVRLRTMDFQTRLLPGMKKGDWEVILNGLMETAMVVEAPDEASAPGQVRAALREYINKAATLANKDDRENLLRGMPCIVQEDGKAVAYFSGPAFVEYLKKTRREEVRGAALFMALKNRMNVGHKRFRVNKDKVVPVWFCELVDGVPEIGTDFTVPDFKPEF